MIEHRFYTKSRSGLKPADRYIPRQTLRNKPCPCGATKGTIMKPTGFNSDNEKDWTFESQDIPVKAKNCCFPRVLDSYYSTLPKLVKNEGKRNYPKTAKVTNG